MSDGHSWMKITRLEALAASCKMSDLFTVMHKAKPPGRSGLVAGPAQLIAFFPRTYD